MMSMITVARLSDPNARPSSRLPAVSLWLSVAIVSMVILGGASDASVAASRGSLLRCTTVSLPAHLPAARSEPVRSVPHDRFMAPTRQAMFFAPKGARCAWHGDAARRG